MAITETPTVTALDRLTAATQERLAVLGQRRAAGTMFTADWRAAVQAVLKDAHIAAAALARGGFDQLDKSTTGLVGSRLRAQYDYLSQFAVQVPANAFDGRAAARLLQYGNGAVRGTYSAILRRDAEADGDTQERNILGSERPCGECPDLSAEGWVPIGTLPEVGTRECLGNCRCEIITR